MKEVKRTRYIADCGRGFWNKKKCQGHEIACTCWKNPKHKTCLTCKHNRVVRDSNGMEHEPQFLQTWISNECQNPAFDYETHFTEAHEKAPDICINCPVWESK